MLPYLVAGVIVSWGGGILIANQEDDKKRKLLIVIVVILVFGELAFLKYGRMAVETINIISSIFGRNDIIEYVVLLAPIGISYYTLSLIGYVLEVYWGSYEAEKNPLKILLFATFFPQLTSGPVTRYEEVCVQLYGQRSFDYRRILSGVQRILWGLFKKLVIADRVAPWVATVYNDPVTYTGFYVAVAVVLFSVQLYTDFSGCMDIILGVSEMFDIKLPENFDTPFFSQTMAEFWRRWHITMGLWFKDYLLYPIQKSFFMRKMTKKLKKVFGKNASKLISQSLTMLVVWIAIGIWHGGEYKFILCSGLIPGFYLIMGHIFEPLFSKLNELFHINTEAISWRVFRMIRTYFLCLTFWVFLKANNIKHGIIMIKSMLSDFNPWILFDGEIYELGMTWKDFNIIYIGVLLIFLVGLFHYNGIKIRDKISKQNICAQWIITILALFSVVIFGIYGPGYDAVDFIYQAF